MKGWGPRTSVCPSNPMESKLFGGISGDLCRDIPEVPENLEKKKLVFILTPYIRLRPPLALYRAHKQGKPGNPVFFFQSPRIRFLTRGLGPVKIAISGYFGSLLRYLKHLSRLFLASKAIFLRFFFKVLEEYPLKQDQKKHPLKVIFWAL